MSRWKSLLAELEPSPVCLGITLLPSLLALLSAVKRHPPTFSLLVLRNVSKFAGPCETSPGCFGSSSSRLLHCACHPGELCMLRVLSGLVGRLENGVTFKAHTEIKKELSVQYLSAWDFSGP